MRKKLVIGYWLLVIGLVFVIRVNAATPTPKTSTTPTPTKPDPTGATSTINLDQQINDLKERIASRVAQLKLVEKRGVLGSVIDVSETQLTLADRDGNNVFIDVDELTHFSSPSAKASFGISDITRDSTVSVLGLYNKESKRILARFVDVITPYQEISGAVSAIDGDNFTITVTTVDQKDIFVDIQSITKTFVYTASDGLTKSGFSKIKQGERVMVVGFWDKNNSAKLLATRILRFPEAKINPKIALFKPGELNVSDKITPSTGSGIKLVPIKK